MSTSGIKSSTFFPEDAVDGLFVVPQRRNWITDDSFALKNIIFKMCSIKLSLMIIK